MLLFVGMFGFGGYVDFDEFVLGFEFFYGFGRVIDKGEVSGFVIIEVGVEIEDGDLVFLGFVEVIEFFMEFFFGDVGVVGVEDIIVEEILVSLMCFLI